MANPSPIAIINYGVGNLRSVQKALERVGHDAVIAASPVDASAAEKLILPGVGAFADGMALLEQHGWVEPVRRHVEAGKPLLGICLGMQLLFDGSEENAPSADQPVPGLGLLPGQVVRFREDGGAGGGDATGGRLKVPHMGWNTISWTRDDPLLAGLAQDSHFYFVHSFYARPPGSGTGSDDGVTSARCHYGGPFTATVWRGNLWATQFHPEKSQQVGLALLKNFADL